jgi:hypothetical protein
MSSIGSEKITQPLFQWQEDSLRAPAQNAAVEGADPTFITVTPTTMKSNYTQIFTEAVVVSDRADVVSTYGRKKEFAYQMAKTAAALKRDVEIAYIGLAGTKAAGNGTTVPSTLDSAQVQIASANIVRTAANDDPLTEQFLVTALQKAYESGAEPSRIMVTPTNSVTLAGFAAAAGRYRTLSGSDAKKLVNVVNLYVSPFGEQKVEINRWLRTENTLVYEPDMWSKPTLRPWERKNLAKTGDSTKAMLLGEFSLKHKNSLGSALIVQKTAGF